jgi:peptide/nickel transport system substrate-binding protein
MKLFVRMIIVVLIASLVMAVAPASLLAQDGACASYNEAPELAEMVAADELPPVGERLPVNPLVVEPAGEIGQYGGTLFDLFDGGRLADFRTYGYENIVRWSVDGSEVIPNIAEGWEVNDDATAYTFFLREGLKWSDGEAFTADDILFWWEHVETNEVINPGGPHPYQVINGEPATVTKIDDYTVRFSWSSPHSQFLPLMASPYGARMTQYAEHYVRQFDLDLNPDGVAQMMEEDGADDFRDWWLNNIGTYGGFAEYNDPDRPLLHPWLPAAPYFTEERFTFVRNPYYFKVDPDCNQLPYIGERTWTRAEDSEVRLLKTIDGESSFCNDNVCSPVNRSVFFDNMEQGNYHFVDAVPGTFNSMQIHMKLNHAVEGQASIMQDINFRIGLSYALDRQTIINTVYLGQGEPWQQSPRPGSVFYNERLGTQYTEYDVDLANEYLDMVMPERDGDGFRLRPDGERFTFAVLANVDFRPVFADILQFYERYWEAVGIDTIIVISNDDVWRQRYAEDDVDAFVWHGAAGSGLIPLLDNNTFTPEAAFGWKAWAAEEFGLVMYGVPATQEAVTPPEGIQRQYEIYTELMSAPIEEQIVLFEELLELAADQFFNIGLSLPANEYYVVNNNLRNVPEIVIRGWMYPGPAPINFETFYFAED